MPINPWKCPQDVADLIREIQTKNHSPRLAVASISSCFDDGKPFVKNKLNLGKVTKFSPFNKLWHATQYDFCVTIPADLWVSVLNAGQREAYLDLQLTRCEVEYIPVYVEFVKNGKTKKEKVKDEWGRVQYTDEIMEDEVSGDPKWKVLPVGMEVLTRSVRRYGPWLDELIEFREAIDGHAKLKPATI